MSGEAPRSVFVIPVWHEDDGSVAALLSEQDMPSGPRTCWYFKHGHCRYGDACRFSHVPYELFEPGLDALGGKREGDEDCATALCREVFEESGELIRDEHLQRLRAWIAAQPLDSAYVCSVAVGKALF